MFVKSAETVDSNVLLFWPISSRCFWIVLNFSYFIHCIYVSLDNSNNNSPHSPNKLASDSTDLSASTELFDW